MKKYIAIALVTVFALTILTACGGGIFGSILGNKKDDEVSSVLSAIFDMADSIDIPDSDTSNSDSSDSGKDDAKPGSSGKTEDKSEFSIGKDEIKSNFKGDFSITFRLHTSASEEYAEMTFVRTSDGYYLATPDFQYLYIRNGDTYDLYFPSDDGFFKVDFIEPQTEEKIESNLGVFYDLITTHSSIKGLKIDGSETVAGRSCDRYTESAVGFGMALGSTYCVDKETGACLKFQYDMAVQGGMGRATFECTEFITSGVKLPEHN